eukprot:TRINITY_DN54_c0_g1_i1.p1 TRINITY_DN54_c0_g1~~TRINITY_DN54_c0_g1_i1.p1  ORF type:complete len:304 (+),score=125.52 TRINITY_DN54_c0_g1_i1:64-975(+)
MSAAKKQAFFDRFINLMETYNKILFVTVDNIGSYHMQKIRKSLRGKAVMLMGKNTVLRRAIRNNLDRNESWELLLPLLVGNVGLIFTDGDLSEIATLVKASRVPAAAKAGIIAPNDVMIPKGQTTLPPTKTSFLQALGIASKINKGTIEITADVHLIATGDKVGASEASLLQTLGITPFTYGLVLVSVYDNGSVFDPKVLDLTDDDIITLFGQGVSQVAALSLATGIPTIAALPHVILAGFKNLLAITMETEYTFEQAEKVKSGAAAAAAAAPAAGAPAAAAAVEEEEEEEEESEDMGFDLFG